ncbi:MAG: ABC transporter substrate-binding protein, partial [Candidatus Woesearchaeota archaeon]
MKQTTWIIIATTMLLLVACTSTPAGKATHETAPIKVGLVTPLTGPGAVWGQNLKDGFQFAVDEINAQGGIKGRMIEAVYDDDACEAAKGVSAFNSLVNTQGVKIITGTVCSSVAMSVIPMTQENGVLYIASGATQPDVPKMGDLVFRLWVGDDYEARAIANFAMNNLSMKTFAV